MLVAVVAQTKMKEFKSKMRRKNNIKTHVSEFNRHIQDTKFKFREENEVLRGKLTLTQL